MDFEKFQRRDLQKSIRKGKDVIRKHISVMADKSPSSFFQHLESDLIKPYLTPKEIREYYENIIEKTPELLLRYSYVIREFVEDSELRKKIFEDIYHKYRWVTYTEKKNIRDLFPVSYFSELLDDRDLNETELDLFLLFYGDNDIESIGNKNVSRYLRSLLNETKIQGCTVGKYLESGFACGGMESNYRDAVEKNQGICLVNNVFLAKFYHRKGEAKKVSLLSRENCYSENEYPVWSRLIYAPNTDSVRKIEEAIVDNEKKIDLENLIIKAVRPHINLDTDSLFKTFYRNNPTLRKSQ
jgi:hypothetical protein